MVPVPRQSGTGTNFQNMIGTDTTFSFENTIFSFLQTFLKTNPNQCQPKIHFKTQPNTTPKLIYNQSKSPLHKVRVFPQIQTQEKSSRVCVLTLNLLKLLVVASSLTFLVRSCTKEQVPHQSLDLHSKP